MDYRQARVCEDCLDAIDGHMAAMEFGISPHWQVLTDDDGQAVSVGHDERVCPCCKEAGPGERWAIVDYGPGVRALLGQ